MGELGALLLPCKQHLLAFVVGGHHSALELLGSFSFTTWLLRLFLLLLALVEQACLLQFVLRRQENFRHGWLGFFNFVEAISDEQSSLICSIIDIHLLVVA